MSDTVLMVDATYFRKTVHEALGHHVDPDYSKVLSFAVGTQQEHKLPAGIQTMMYGQSRLVEARYYDAMPYQDPRDPDSERTQRRAKEFADAADAGFVLRQGVCVKKLGSSPFHIFEQHCVDTAMTADLVAFAYKGIRRVILVTGNQDIVPGVEVARDKGVEVMLCVDWDYRGQKLISLATQLYRFSYHTLRELVKPALVESAA